MSSAYWHVAYLTLYLLISLSPFAMCPAFPDPDYYGDSVALGLAPVGDPEFSDHRTFEHGLGRLLIPTPGIISRYLTARACRA